MGPKSFSLPLGPQENALFGADVHDFRRRRPWPERLSKTLYKKIALIFLAPSSAAFGKNHFSALLTERMLQFQNQNLTFMIIKVGLRKTKGQQLSDKIVLALSQTFHTFSHFFPQDFLSKSSLFLENNKKKTKLFCSLVVAGLSSSKLEVYSTRLRCVLQCTSNLCWIIGHVASHLLFVMRHPEGPYSFHPEDPCPPNFGGWDSNFGGWISVLRSGSVRAHIIF